MDNKVTIQSAHQPRRLSVSLRTAEGLMWPLYFNQSPLIIGRSISCDLRLPYPWISLQHVEVTWSHQGISARDLYAKTPVRIKGVPLQSAPSSPSVSLSLSFPLLSIDLHLDDQEYVSNIYDKAMATRHLWRPESGWLLWSPDQSHITVRQMSMDQQQRHSRPPNPIMPHQWKTANEQEHNQQGQYWFLCDPGHYVITHAQDELQLLVDPQALTIHGHSYVLSTQVRSIPILLGQHTLALTQTPHPPTQSWIQVETPRLDRKWWSIFSKT